MAVSNFISQIWSARLLEHLNNSHVYANLVNRNYEGEITGCGNTVKIISVGDVTVGDYTENTDIGVPQEIPTSQQLLTIDQQKYFNFQVDDVEKAQTNADIMDGAMKSAAYGLANVTDRYIAGLYTGVSAVNAIGSDSEPVAISKDNAYDEIIALKVKLDKANVPAEGRWIVIPPEMHGVLLTDPRFVSSGSELNTAALLNGNIGMAAGFTIYLSNNVPNSKGSKYKVIAGTNDAIFYAEQIISTEAYRLEKRFADAVKGLHVYGAKLIRPEGIAVLTANFS